jgi:hypothetical protein
MTAQAEVNRFVLDSLRDGPAEVEPLYRAAFDMLGAPRGMVNAALMHFKARRLERPADGVEFVAAADNLAAIWWAKRKPQAHCWSSATGGNAA